MKNIKKLWVGHRITAIVLAALLTSTVLTAIIIPNLNTVDAADVPGTEAYYEARWADVVAKFSWTASDVESQWVYDGNYTINTALTSQASPKGLPDHIGQMWFVRSYEQLRYACENVASGERITLQKNIDCGGAEGKLIQTIRVNSNCTIDGSGYSIFNINLDEENPAYMSIYPYLSLFDNRKTHIVNYQNISIKSVKVISSTAAFAAIISPVLVGGENIENCSVDKGLVRSAAGVCALVAGFGAQSKGDVNISNSYVSKVSTFARQCSNGFCGDFGVTADKLTVKNCYAIDGDIISQTGHCGAFGGCDMTAMTSYENCFTNNNIYANTQGGGFLGTTHGNTLIKNCYSAGKVEGVKDIGGFFGSADISQPQYNNSTLRIDGCYSTALCGISANGTNMGGFIGSSQSTATTNPQAGTIAVNITNCYAAGETGDIDTSADSDHITVSPTTGGFVGDNTNIAETNCYYDKQTTAMREWASGAAKNAAGVTGLLTTDSQKSGNGMTNPAFAASLGADYVNNLGEGYYPELSVFANVTAASWGLKTPTEWQAEPEAYSSVDAARLAYNNDIIINTIKAYSQASVATVKLDTYDTDYNGNALPATTYDTVRDVTARFPLTSDTNIAWERCGVTGSATLATGTGAKSQAFVIDSAETAKNVFEIVNINGAWVGDTPTPGVDWARVTATVGDQVGRRALRICPRTGIEAGLSRVVGSGMTYDHADDMMMVYSTGARVADADTSNDYTYGIFPDYPVAARQQQLLNLSAFANYTALEAKYNSTGQNNTFFDIDAAYMERTAASLTTGVKPPVTSSSNKINAVVIKQVLGENPDGTLNYGTPINLTQTDEADRWNGIEPFYTDDVHRVFEVGYYWSLSDGRYLYDSKRIEYPDAGATHTVTIMAQNIAGYAVSDKAYLDAYDISTENGDADPSIAANLGSSTKARDVLTNQPHGYPAATSWKLTEDIMVGLKIAYTYTNPDNGVRSTWTESFDAGELPQNAGETTTLTTKAPYRTYIIDENGNTAWRIMLIDKEYVVTLDDSGEYKIAFNTDNPDYGHGIYIEDVDMDIDVMVILDAVPLLSNDFIVKKTLKQPAEEDELFVFRAEYRGNGGEAGAVLNTMYAAIRIIAGESTAAVTFRNVPSGWYTVTEMDANWRFELDKDALENDNEGAAVDKASGSVTYWVGART